MEYFLGSIITIIVVIVLNHFLSTKNISESIKYNPTQSEIYEIVRYFIEEEYQVLPQIKTQATKHLDSIYTKILVLDNRAYWIAENAVFVADMVNNEIDTESTREVDTMSMDKVQLDKMIFIIEQLTEGTPNDYWNSGKS